MVIDKIKEFIVQIIEENGDEKPSEINPDTNLRDLGLSSFDLATLTVMIEDEYDVDVFEDGLVFNIEQIAAKIDQ